MSGWGGHRAGAGQKGAMELVSTAVATEQPLATPPDDLPEAQQAFWRTNAVLAIEKGTLTRHTESAFRLLCEMDAERRKTLEKLDADGRTFIKVTVDGAGVEHQELKAHPLKSDYRGLCKQVEASLKNFGLSPFGKPEPARPKAKSVNQFQAQVG
jgi:hypothetical protein